MIHDHHARQIALDPKQSFIVQAPAGSGKTELLVQRFLALLAHTDRAPEEIIAITFTRKAASEMRQRVLEALQVAQGAAPAEPHARKTWELGGAALERDRQLGWNLLENPNRLRVQTIDALCASIARQAPLLSGLGITSHLLEKDINQYYLVAARQLLNTLEEESPLSNHLACLLLHLDNRVETVEALLMRMLARRDQWLPHLISHGKSLSSKAFRQTLEAGLYHAVAEILAHCAQALPPLFHSELLALMRFSAEHFPGGDQVITDIKNLMEFPEATPENYQSWLFLAQMLLTKDGAWRRAIDKRQGFPSEEKAIKQRMQLVLQQLSDNEMLRQSFANLLEAPPVAYTESQWQVIAALCELLPLLVAELKVLFKEKSVADYSEVAMAAAAALGDSEYPTDLTLTLDAKIRHLLVDEFQDTSMTQFRLLEKLTAGWQPNDGRSLFLVGDPMQSIYRFREAEVGLFLKAQQEGLGDIKLQPLVLQANFRSTPELIEWINSQFSTIFPMQSDISAGAVTFSPCMATKSVDKASGAFLEVFSSANSLSSVTRIIEVVQQTQLQNSQNTIAILVRSRSHLKAIIPALKKANLQFTALEIDPLYKQSIVQDLLSLTGALLHVGDRLSWLSVLRAPWCGLTLHDLHVISQRQLKKSLWEVLPLFAEIAELSEDGRRRLAALVPIFRQGLAQRGRLPFRAWIEETWRALNGPACATDQAELASAEAYFKLLSTFDQVGEMPDLATLRQTIQTQYATPAAVAACRLHIMTIHKAKGLEFDTVIIPYLESKNRGDDDQLLLWLDRPRARYTNDLILAPIKAKHQKHDPIYAWLREIEKTKAQHELTRLLYVAATRAKKNLYLMATVSVENNVFKKPDAGSFLELLCEPFKQIAEKLLLESGDSAIAFSSQDAVMPRVVRRLKIDEYQPVAEKLMSSVSHAHFQWGDQTARHTGTVIHQVLEQIGREGLAVWTAQRMHQEKSRWKMWLMRAGYPQHALAEGVLKVQAAIDSILNDPRGQWILTAHAEHQSEYALTTIVDDEPQHFIIDRTFVDENHIRWIIDYKTGRPAEGQDVAHFLAQAQSTHREQLEKYAALMRRCDDRPIRLGLYFPAFGGWCEWG